MIIRNTKFLLIVIFSTSSLAFFFMNYRITLHHSLISSNYANIQSNPFEFLHMSSHPYYEAILAAIKEGLDKPLHVHFSQEELINLGIPKNSWSLSTKDLLNKKGYQEFKLLDKEMRKIGISRYSLLNDLRDLDGKEVKISEEADHFSLWDLYFNNRLNVNTVRLASGRLLPDFVKAKAGLKLFDILIIRVLRKKKLLSAARTIQKIFYEGAIGNPKEKAQQLYRFYQQSDIICIQESSKYIVDLMSEEYHVIGQPDASVIFLKKGLWKKVKKIEIKIKNYPTDRMIVIIAEHERSKKKIILGSIHSDNKGSSSLPILKAIQSIIQKNRTFRRLPIILAHDANTSTDKKENKLRSKLYYSTAKKTHLEHVFDLKHPTTHKIRSWAQAQLDKAGILIKDKSNWILVRKIKIQTQSIKEAGPNEENPTDHALLYIRFSLPAY